MASACEPYFQATLPPPTVKADLPEDWRTAAAIGGKQFEALGCASCHITSLPLKSLIFVDPAPYDMAGTLRRGETSKSISIDLAGLPFAQNLQKNAQGEWLIPLFSDLKRHLIVDSQELLKNEWEKVKLEAKEGDLKDV